MPPIKTEPGVRIKPEHEPRFDFSSIPRAPVPSAPVKREHHTQQEDRVKHEDRKPDLSSSTHNSQSRRRPRFKSRHSKNYMVYRLRAGETIRAQYRRSEGTVVFTLSSRATDILEDFPEEADRAEENIFDRLRRAHFNIRPIEPSGFLYRKIHHAPISQTVFHVNVEQISEKSEAKDAFDSEDEWVFPSPRTGCYYVQHEEWEDSESPPPSDPASVNFQPVTHPLPISSMSGEPSKDISAASRSEEKPKTQVSQVAPSESSSTTAFNSSSALPSGSHSSNKPFTTTTVSAVDRVLEKGDLRSPSRINPMFKTPSIFGTTSTSGKPSLLGTTSTSNNPSLSGTVPIAGKPSLFSNTSTSNNPSSSNTAPIAGKPSLLTTASTFGTTSTSGKPSLFGTTSTSNNPSLSGTVPMAGRQSLLTTASTAGKPSLFSTASTFGRPSTLGSSSTFGTPSIIGTQSTPWCPPDRSPVTDNFKLAREVVLIDSSPESSPKS
ncbi:hypothetical protein B0T20DRAFT_220564 [Sordaria brevicollis]|uniref:Uncharacterized protein n=1 Tax=Sordaria brevicollis TaxID=83679 RepID=A0AAE0UAX5_SORBR|nr:hypothetical protein B0T20DRAFT_220564 [Sordaria brevicollis]